jgi:hypothetical protein
MLALRHLEKLALESSGGKSTLLFRCCTLKRQNKNEEESRRPGEQERAGEVTATDENQLAVAKRNSRAFDWAKVVFLGGASEFSRICARNSKEKFPRN